MKDLRKHINETALQPYTWSDEGGRNILADMLTAIGKEHARDRAVAFIAETLYLRDNPGSLLIPQEAYDDAAAAYDAWLIEQEQKEA